MQASDIENIDFVAFRPASVFTVPVTVDADTSVLGSLQAEISAVEVNAEGLEEFALSGPRLVPVPLSRYLEFTNLPPGRYRLRLIHTLQTRHYESIDSSTAEIQLHAEVKAPWHLSVVLNVMHVLTTLMHA